MIHPTRKPSKNGDPRGSGRAPTPAVQAAPPEVPPSRLGTALLALVMVLWVFAFSPEPRVIATVPGLVAWLAIVERCRRFREVVLWGVLFGAVATSLGYRWLADTIQLFGGLQAVNAYLALALFGVWNTIHGVIFAAFYRGMLRHGRRPHPLVTVALWVACESLPIRMFGWMSGHGAVDVPPLAQAAEWGGVVGVSFVLCCLVVPVYEWLRWAFVRYGAPARPGAALVTFLIGVALYGYGLVRYDAVRTSDEAATRHLRVAIVQPDIGTLDKRLATANGGVWRQKSLDAYEEVTRRALTSDPDLVVWPETAITDSTPLGDAQLTNGNLRTRGYDFLLEGGERAAFLVGLYEKAVPPRTVRRVDRRYNVAALRQPGAADAPWTKVRKVFLIPFGEAMPLGLREDLLPQNFKMLPGEMPQDLLVFHGLTFAPFLCYEGILPDHVRELTAGMRPDVLVSLTNDSWFGDTWEPHQHLSFTRFRAIEHRAPLVRATNTGISAFVSATGDVVARLGVGARDALVRDVPIVNREPTVYVRYGHRLPWLLWLVALLGWLTAMVRPPPVT